MLTGSRSRLGGSVSGVGKGLQNPYSSVRFRPAPPAFLPSKSPVDIPGRSRREYATNVDTEPGQPSDLSPDSIVRPQDRFWRLKLARIGLIVGKVYADVGVVNNGAACRRTLVRRHVDRDRVAIHRDNWSRSSTAFPEAVQINHGVEREQFRPRLQNLLKRWNPDKCQFVGDALIPGLLGRGQRRPFMSRRLFAWRISLLRIEELQNDSVFVMRVAIDHRHGSDRRPEGRRRMSWNNLWNRTAASGVALHADGMSRIGR